VTLLITPRARALMILGVLLLAAAGAGMMVLSRAERSSDSSPDVVTPAPKTTPRTTTTAPHAVQASKPSAAAPAVKPKPKKQTGAAGRALTARDQLPAPILEALKASRVVVVALYDPKAKIDNTAVAEASAGAQLAGTTFVQVDVTSNQVDSLNARYGVIQDPAVLVLRPPGDLVVRIDGFADRDTVAQAATNAAS
jgi:thiol:disulfide interchange protein